MIPFNKPHLTGDETKYIVDAVESGKISGNGVYTQRCQKFFEEQFGFRKCLLTTSCTDALEMAAILAEIEPGDEVILPSYTFVSTANAFVLRGAKLVFADSYSDHPNMDHGVLSDLITAKTKAIVVVHYAGMACEMDTIMNLANENNILVIEDAAQAIDSYYKGKPLGSIGHLAAFSFHETKNIISGEGGLLVINDPRFVERAEIIWEKGTNRAAFFRGETDKYNWVDIGSSFLPSEVVAAFLYAQLENLQKIQDKRKSIWDYYKESFKTLEEKGVLKTPVVPENGTNNAHMFYLVLPDLETRTELIQHLKNSGVHAVFHYLSLHKSPFFLQRAEDKSLPHSEQFTDTLVRLPLYYDLQSEDLKTIRSAVFEYFESAGQEPGLNSSNPSSI